MGKKPSFSRLAHREATREAVKQGAIAPQKRNLSPQEVIEIQEINRICMSYAFQANHVKANTAMIPPMKFLWFTVPRGKALAAEIEAMARLFDQVKTQRISQILTACGYPSGFLYDMNLATGQITASAPSTHEAGITKEAA